MYRCKTCQRRTEDIDNPPCGKDPCEEFYPEQIPTIHSLYFEGDQRKVLCTGKLLSPGIRGVGGPYGVTCIRCKRKRHELALRDKAELEGISEENTD